ncbi:S-adenosyl-l-methionine hydroxide adenosyltransferase family protein [Mucilaginibacter sp. BJC16-A38]|uniref:SAM hydrolase/SAM-dependent halogenase family protein n=1 Tax=Mucilaginibacter phenanthrenivorans TaxID=1234842 RepID=UPI0021585066|nr:S-adenosyl-l-methionine hydroxide adenosyltransferase family protein [Mucilaginibacter phenanthrenivorans]MCR8558286.1 S-adenosyl-l-methionine hydroxide adenosyltransferase family protein [Mucilaginibacter phenanthrenivorans]
MNKNLRSLIFFTVLSLSSVIASAQNKIVVFQSDFGLKDGAVSAMKGVSMGVSTDLKLFDLTHEIPAYNIWEASYRLEQTVRYWPAGTVFVSVVDPGVGTARKSVVLKTKSGHFIVTPDNGTLTLVAESLGIDEIRSIDEEVNRRKDSKKSYTFHGRDVYAFTAARLAAGVITFEQVGPLLPKQVVSIPYQQAVLAGKAIKGDIPVLDVQYGNVWTNIPQTLFDQLQPKYGDIVHVIIRYKDKQIYKGDMPYSQTFGGVAEGKPLAYINSLLQLSFAINMGDFGKIYHVESGADWSVEVSLN